MEQQSSKNQLNQRQSWVKKSLCSQTIWEEVEYQQNLIPRKNTIKIFHTFKTQWTPCPIIRYSLFPSIEKNNSYKIHLTQVHQGEGRELGRQWEPQKVDQTFTFLTWHILLPQHKRTDIALTQAMHNLIFTFHFATVQAEQEINNHVATPFWLCPQKQRREALDMFEHKRGAMIGGQGWIRSVFSGLLHTFMRQWQGRNLEARRKERRGGELDRH